MRINEPAVKWGTCETTATNSSWELGSITTTSAPSDTIVERTKAKLSSSVFWPGVNTHAAPLKRSALAPAIPSCSLPAIGWPGTKWGSSISFDISPLTLPTSVTTEAPSLIDFFTASTIEPTGVATKTISVPSIEPSVSIAPISIAALIRDSFLSDPITLHPFSLSP